MHGSVEAAGCHFKSLEPTLDVHGESVVFHHTDAPPKAVAASPKAVRENDFGTEDATKCRLGGAQGRPGAHLCENFRHTTRKFEREILYAVNCVAPEAFEGNGALTVATGFLDCLLHRCVHVCFFGTYICVCVDSASPNCFQEIG